MPIAVGTTPGPWLCITVLLMMSTGISRMSVSLLRSRLGQRTEMSNSFSPSTMLREGLRAQGARARRC